PPHPRLRPGVCVRRGSSSMSTEPVVTPTLEDPLATTPADPTVPPLPAAAPGPYDQALAEGDELRARPYTVAGPVQILRQHAKERMTVWERIEVLKDKGERPTILYQNWGPKLDGA